jgi:hypothetical protein
LIAPYWGSQEEATLFSLVLYWRVTLSPTYRCSDTSTQDLWQTKDISGARTVLKGIAKLATASVTFRNSNRVWFRGGSALLWCTYYARSTLLINHPKIWAVSLRIKGCKVASYVGSKVQRGTQHTIRAWWRKKTEITFRMQITRENCRGDLEWGRNVACLGDPITWQRWGTRKGGLSENEANGMIRAKTVDFSCWDAYVWLLWRERRPLLFY